MPSITYDGRSFMIDGKRIWIVSGSIHYARLPRESWVSAIRQARRAGFNTIETPVFWALHEPRPGTFDFEGELELRHFVKLVADEGLHCILRPGPYVDSAWTMGGLPGWLREQDDIEFRTTNQTFLEAAGRYLSALASHLKGLQGSGPGASGPIILVQNETAWTCGDEQKGPAYLGELHRYLREAGFHVPTIASNQLWQSVEGEVDCWAGSSHLLQAMRQLRQVRPDQPRMVMSIPAGQPACLGLPAPEPISPALLQRTIAEALAGGGQFNLDPFHGGTNFAFRAGRLGGELGGFVTNTNDMHAPLTEALHPGPSFSHVRRIATFASRFARVLAHHDPDYHPIVLDPAGVVAGRDRPGVSVIHQEGSQGSIVWVFAGGSDGRAPIPKGPISLVLSDGRSCQVSLGGQLVSWVLMDVQIAPRLRIDLCTLNALGAVGNCFVCFGPAGAAGTISVNGSPLEVEAPRGKNPLVLDHEGMTLVIANEDQVDAIQMTDDAVFIGAVDFDEHGEPIPGPSTRTLTRIDADGQTHSEQVRPVVPKTPKGPTLGEWEMASCDAYLDGSSPRYAMIERPDDLTRLGAADGYGWYRVVIRATSAKRPRIRVPDSGDRLTFFSAAQPVGVIGRGPAAGDDLTLPLTKGSNEIVILAENLGRASVGLDLDERKGLFGPLYEAKTLRIPKGTIEEKTILRPLEHKSPLWGVHEDSTTIPRRLTWSFTHRRKSPIIMTLPAMPTLALLLVNGAFFRALDEGFQGPIVLDESVLSRGNNTIELTLLDVFADIEAAEDALGAITPTFHEGVADIAAKGEWSFAKWEPPSRGAFASVSKTAMSHIKVPAWWRTRFEVQHPEVPLYLDVSGLSKGQIFVNGNHLGRYWAGDGSRKTIGPQLRHFIPRPWLREDAPNELLIFDELGGNPARASLVHDARGGPTLS